MSDDLDRFRIFGARARDGANKLFRGPVTWEIFSKTLGWFQHCQENSYTPEQLAAIEDGYRNCKAIKKRKPKQKQADQ